MTDGTGRTILEEAAEIVSGQRLQDYGDRFESFSAIAQGWSMVLGHEVTPEQVILCMVTLKVARAKGGGFHRDSFVDIAGYVQCYEYVAEERERRRTAECGHAFEVDGRAVTCRYCHDAATQESLPGTELYKHPENGRLCERAPGGLDPWIVKYDVQRDPHDDPSAREGKACYMAHDENGGAR